MNVFKSIVVKARLGRKQPAKRQPEGAGTALSRLLLDVASGLQALHNAGVVFSELAPTRVLIGGKDGRAVLTDSELAKLMDGSPSVSIERPPPRPASTNLNFPSLHLPF